MLQTELVYDSLTMSTAATTAFRFAGGILLAAGVWIAWLKTNGHGLHAGVKFLAFAGVLMLVIGVATYYEQEIQTRRFEVRTVDGPVMGHWTKHERVRNWQSSGSSYSNREWEGFQVGGVPFVYDRLLEQNFFHNAGPSKIEISDGMWLRIQYFQEGEGGQFRVIRIERAAKRP